MVEVAQIRIWGKLVGAIRWDAQQQLGSFQYHPDFLKTGYDLSPIKMPISQGTRVHTFPELRKGRDQTEDTFKGLPGLLADALPDRYGNKLIDTWLAQQGRTADSMNPIEKLCFIGNRGMGALEFEPSAIAAPRNSQVLEIDSLISTAKKMLNEREAFLTDLSADEEKAMRDILKIGTSAGGARPKAVIAYNPKTGAIEPGQTKIPKGYEHWLIKLDGVSGEQFGESAGWGRIEYAYYLMALDCGITMSTCQLLEENGRAHFMTKRFDRAGNTKHHMQTLCGLQHYDYNDMYGYSYEQVFMTMRMLRLPDPDAEQMYRRMVFNVLATNYDDHTKNFSFMMREGDKGVNNWELAPAYDLCFSYDPTNHWVSQQTLSIHGKRTDITTEDLLHISKENNIKKAKDIIAQTAAVVKQWNRYANQAGVRADLVERIGVKLGAE
jgi:serine/threonine-protein kinase HipA